MPARRNVDFLVVVALADELEAVIRHFGPVETTDREHYAAIRRKNGGEYRVAIVNVGDQGPDAAQRETSNALSRMRARYVLLVGIAAGFPEDGVGLGDLMVPRWVVDYEHAKIREVGLWLWKRPRVEHRDHARQVNQNLFHTAQTIATGKEPAWTKRIVETRPDGTTNAPRVFAKNDSTIGCGSKVVASRLYEGRKWLREEITGILGLEMESIGVLNACEGREVGALVVKASQDSATAIKDRRSQKDEWRKYACDVAAAFARELVEVFRASNDSLIAEHLSKLDEIVDGELAREAPLFEYTVSLAQTATDVKSNRFQLRNQSIHSLLPDDSTPYVAILGGGGTGKSNIARRLIAIARHKDLCPVLIDLKHYVAGSAIDWQQLQPSERERIEQDALESILARCTIPAHSLDELRVLSSETQFLAIADGLNEIPPNEQTLLVNFLKGLSDGSGRKYALVTARLAISGELSGFRFASVDQLAPDEVRGLYDRSFGSRHESAFDQLEPEVKKILRRPFFLALAMRGQRLEGLHTWSAIFERFLSERVRLNTDALDQIAAAAFACLDDAGGIKINNFRARLGDREYQHLVDAEVIARDERGFDHELWRDYLVSRHLARRTDLWRQDTFDHVTVKASSFESLPLAMEQITQPVDRQRFIKAVHNWSLAGAVECLEYAAKAEMDEPMRGTMLAILASIADKQFDPVANTRKKAVAQLAEQSLDQAKRFIGVSDRVALVRALEHENVGDVWFKEWLSVFRLDTGDIATDHVVEMIQSDDSVVGWTVANALKRAAVSDQQLSTLRRFYDTRMGPADQPIRWRIVHALGSHGSAENVALLRRAVEIEKDLWIRYGSVRSLVEIAALSNGQLRDEALNAMTKVLPSIRSASTDDRRRILRELVVSVDVRGAVGDWKARIYPVLENALASSDEGGKEELRTAIAAFTNRDATRD